VRGYKVEQFADAFARLEKLDRARSKQADFDREAKRPERTPGMLLDG
jgi:hypothetical protein